MELKLRSAFFLPIALRLIIVPYGIETKKVIVKEVFIMLIIVPYGIETTFAVPNLGNTTGSYNRTLWN